MKWVWLAVLVAASSAFAESREVCLSRCLKTAKQLEGDCLKHPKVPGTGAAKKQDCAEARKTIEAMCPAECSANPPRDHGHD